MPLRDRRLFVIGLLLALAAGSILRLLWLTADPPTHATVGIVWHDEGAWVHNARNRVLWGTWRTDEWNPMFIAPVFTALEYLAFSIAGVGTWQARTVSVAGGLVSVVLLALGLRACAGGRAAAIGAILLATNYVFVMWNRAALMESTMTAFLVAGWAAYAVAARRPSVGFLAGAAAAAAWFTKASAAFFVAAIVMDAALTILLSLVAGLRRRLGVQAPDAPAVRAACWTIGGLVLVAAFVAVVFREHWSEYWFYNWQTSVARKPEYSVRALLDRASWIPIAHDFFTRMWLVTAAAALSLILLAARWRTTPPAHRMLVWWVLVGFLELVVHDSGNERRYVMFVPALVALAALLLSSEEPSSFAVPELDGTTRVLMFPLLLVLSYVVIGALGRLPFLYTIGPGVRLSAATAAVAVLLIAWRWRPIVVWLARQNVPATASLALAAMVISGDLAQYWQWARHRTTSNYEASKAVGRALPGGTLVHGKLANGLSLENSIKPVFVGRGFGNYDDRKTRDDVRYILTYVVPRLGYEGPVILDVLEAYPHRAKIMTFEVAETNPDTDRAALFDKFGGAKPGRADD